MKKILLITVLALLSTNTIFAQENAIKINPLAILGGTDLVSYERAFFLIILLVLLVQVMEVSKLQMYHINQLVVDYSTDITLMKLLMAGM